MALSFGPTPAPSSGRDWYVCIYNTKSGVAQLKQKLPRSKNANDLFLWSEL